MTEPSSPRRATAEEVKTAIAAYLNADRPTHYEDMEATLNAVFALPSTHDEAIRAEEREACALVAQSSHPKGHRTYVLMDDVAAAIRARASSPRPVPADGVETWPTPKVTNPDIAKPTGVPYIDGLIHQLLDAQQDIREAANESMSQSLADAAELMDEVETVLRKAALLPPGTVAPEGFVLVPREPTLEMVRAGQQGNAEKRVLSHALVMWIWADMVATAPQVLVTSEMVRAATKALKGGSVKAAVEAALLAAAPSPPASETA